MNELIHKYLDGQMTEAEQKSFGEKCDSDKILKQDFESAQEAVQATKTLYAPDFEVSADFVDNVMDRISQEQPEKGSALQKALDFLLRARNLRWNMASAIAAAAILVAVIVTILIQPPAVTPPQVIKSPVISAGQDAQVAYVKLFLYMPNAKEISLCGDFNDWKTDEIRLNKAEDSGLWTVTIPLSLNETYQYMFVVDGQKWMPDPMVANYVDDGFGGRNSVIDLRNMW